MVHTLARLLTEAALLSQAVAARDERLQAREAVTPGLGAILALLKEDGASTVPAIARKRHVSRQNVRSVVHRLRTLALVEQVPNPAHHRSHLVRLTKKGRRAVARIQARERRSLLRLDVQVRPSLLLAACDALRAVRRAIDPASNHAAPG